MRATLEQKLRELQADNAAKLEQMRATVDEKLHATLETRLTESFGNVTTMLAQVHQGLGDMNKLAADVGGLQRVLTNVKSRGVFGEVQLAGLLEQVFAPDQYAANVATVPGSSERVEFAVRFPGSTGDAPVWLPIDAKFPREDYERLLDAQERADVDAARAAGDALERRVRLEAARIRDKYVGRAAHHRVRDPVPADRRPVRGSAAPAGPGRSAAARPAHRRRRPDHAAGADDQFPDGLPHAGDREALQRGLAHAGRGQDRVRQVRRRARRGARRSSTRPATRSRRPGVRTRAIQRSCATSNRCRAKDSQRLLGAEFDGCDDEALRSTGSS